MSSNNSRERSVKQAYQQAQKLNAVDHLARDLVHELKNCLGGISGAAELLEIDAGGTTGVDDLIKVIFSSTDNALSAINTLAEFISNRPNLSASEKSPCDIHAFLDQQYRYWVSCMGKQITVELRKDAENPVIQCDANLMAHIAMNLVLNAKESINERGQLIIQTKLINIAENSRPPLHGIPQGHYLDICFADTGCGIDIKDLNDVCAANFSNKDQHAGMGLSLAEEFTRQQSGYLRIESSKDRGTKVHLLFPS